MGETKRFGADEGFDGSNSLFYGKGSLPIRKSGGGIFQVTQEFRKETHNSLLDKYGSDRTQIGKSGSLSMPIMDATFEHNLLWGQEARESCKAEESGEAPSTNGFNHPLTTC